MGRADNRQARPGTAATRSVIVLARDVDPDDYERRVKEGDLPRHYAHELRERSGTEIVTLEGVRATPIDSLLGRLIGSGRQWRVARELRRHAKDSFVYLTDETLGIPYLMLSPRRDHRNTAMFVMGSDSTRVVTLLRLLGRLGVRPLVFTDAESSRQVVSDKMGIPATDIAVLPVAIDEDFYSPPESRVPKARPLVLSAGVETRDYRTLAEAVADLDVDVVVVAESSAMAASASVDLPDVLPSNFRLEKVSTRGLRDLYRQADIVAVTTKYNTFGAGATVALEGMSTGCPVVLSQTPGLMPFVDANAAIGVPVHDAARLRAEITRLLSDPAAARELGDRARAYVLRVHATSACVDSLLAAFERHGVTLAPSGSSA